MGTLMMGTDIVPETSVSTCNQLTRLCAREDFIEFSRRESSELCHLYEFRSKLETMCEYTGTPEFIDGFLLNLIHVTDFLMHPSSGMSLLQLTFYSRM
jgi:hypothetical protein